MFRSRFGSSPLYARKRPNCLCVPFARRSFTKSTIRHATEQGPVGAGSLQPGAHLHGFTLRRIQKVPELQLTALQLQHDKTGADYLHIDRDDKNNVFSIGFKTNPPDDTGVPHILEHTTLCGSKRCAHDSHQIVQAKCISYPIRDPFFNMLPRSLANFMNAFTSADHTTYPFATTNRQDFRNLMSVYLDATLHPLLKATDFAQEGWRVGPDHGQASESAEGQEAKDGLEFKGVVYNEMKGQMSDANYLFYTRYQDHIFPSIHNSGGDPQRMTDLTYDQLKSFHAHNYHPSNARVFSYGNMPLDEHLVEVNRQFNLFQQRQADSEIKAPIQLHESETVTVNGPVDPLVDKDMQHKVSTSWILGDTSDVQETFALGIISSLLLSGYGSPLYQALIESGLGPDFSPNTGMDSAGKTGIFCVGLNGVRAEDVPRVHEATVGALNEVRQKGFDATKVQGLLHQLELGLKHKTANFGLDLMNRLQPGWFNGVDPFDALAWNQIVATFKKRYAEGQYLEGLLGKYLLTDRHFTFIMKPFSGFEEGLAKDEQDRLSAKVAEVQEAQHQSDGTVTHYFAQKEQRVAEAQKASKDQDLSCLPRLSVSDIPKMSERKEVYDSRIGDVKVQWREANTNGLTYFRALSTLTGLPEEVRQLVPLFCDALFRLGTRTMSVEELEDAIKLKTGGMKASYYCTGAPQSSMEFTEGLSLSGFALDGNIPDMYALFQKILYETDFESPEAEIMLRELINADANGALNAVANEGHAYCRRFAQQSLSPNAAANEQTSGLTQVRFMNSLALRETGSGLSDIVTRLKKIQEIAVGNSPRLRVALTCGSESAAHNESALEQFLSGLSHAQQLPYKSSSLEEMTKHSSLKTFFPLPYQVSYLAAVLPTVPYVDPASAHLQVLAQLVTNKYMLHEVREKGGAYGAGAFASPLGATFGFYSYRDPNPQNTLRVISSLGEWLSTQKWGDQELEEAKLSVFQGLDAPESVSEEGMTRFLSGVDQDMEQKKREQLLSASVPDVLGVANKFLLGSDRTLTPNNGKTLSRVAVLGPPKDWLNETNGWKIEDLQSR